MKSFPPMFDPKPDGGYEISAAGVLILAARTFYHLQHENSPERVENARETMRAILLAVRRAGYARIAQLSSALVVCACTAELGNMANEACAKVRVEEMRAILARVIFC